MLRQIWSLASVYKNKSLCKDEFLIFTAYVMYIQGGGSASSMSFNSLTAFFNKPTGQINLPRFQGIDLPKAPPPVDVFNPFGTDADASNQNADEDDFGDFGDFNGGATTTPTPAPVP